MINLFKKCCLTLKTVENGIGKKMKVSFAFKSWTQPSINCLTRQNILFLMFRIDSKLRQIHHFEVFWTKNKVSQP